MAAERLGWRWMIAEQMFDYLFAGRGTVQGL
jgi:hypothetical protein